MGSFIEIKKGFMSLIGKVEAERIIEEKHLAGAAVMPGDIGDT
ncbi:hypothetical protein [Escherichia coli]|nr:hypothetical protein [Escherichia coli]